MKTAIMPTNNELFFAEDDIIVSKTDVKGRLWSGLAEAINPEQPPLRVQTLGNVATHHYGLGARKCVKEWGGALNRFPRRIMMEALGAYLLEQAP